jgi:hypothetical protein
LEEKGIDCSRREFDNPMDDDIYSGFVRRSSVATDIVTPISNRSTRGLWSLPVLGRFARDAGAMKQEEAIPNDLASRQTDGIKAGTRKRAVMRMSLSSIKDRNDKSGLGSRTNSRRDQYVLINGKPVLEQGNTMRSLRKDAGEDLKQKESICLRRNGGNEGHSERAILHLSNPLDLHFHRYRIQV